MLATALDGPGAPARGLLPTALRLSLRPHGTWALERVLGAADLPPAALAVALRASPLPAVRLLGVRLSLERGLLTPGTLTELALTARDRTVRRLCTRALLGRVAPGDPERLLDPLLGASSAVTRSSAVTALHRAGRGPEAAAHLADPSAVVRSAARLVLRLDGEDPVARYRALCAGAAAPGLPPGARRSAESGAPDAPALLRPLAGHPEGRVRAAALASLACTSGPARRAHGRDGGSASPGGTHRHQGARPVRPARTGGVAGLAGRPRSTPGTYAGRACGCSAPTASPCASGSWRRWRTTRIPRSPTRHSAPAT